jgi:hypothetical protein
MTGGTQLNTPPDPKQSYLPSRKVGAGALAGALSVVLVWALNNLVLTGPTKITGEVASAITTILTFAVGYFVRESE